MQVKSAHSGAEGLKMRGRLRDSWEGLFTVEGSRISIGKKSFPVAIGVSHITPASLSLGWGMCMLHWSTVDDDIPTTSHSKLEA